MERIQINPIRYPKDIAEMRAWFSTDKACLEYLEWMRWGNGFICPWCHGSEYWIIADGRRKCQDCDRTISVTSNTIFERTRIPLTVWFEAAWLFVASKNGVSATTLHNLLPINTYQTAWTMLSKFRYAISSTPKRKLEGVVEVDEWMQGGVRKGVKGRGVGKNIVLAAVEKRPGGRVRFAVAPNTKTATLGKFIKDNVVPGSKVITDAWVAYPKATGGYTHVAHNEARSELEAHELLPAVHRVFSLADRLLLGTYQGSTRKEHLQEYLDEFAFRYNRRNSNDRGLLFYRLMEHAVKSDSVTYPELVKIGRKKPVKPTPPPKQRSKPGSLDVEPAFRPWLN